MGRAIINHDNLAKKVVCGLNDNMPKHIDSEGMCCDARPCKYKKELGDRGRCTYIPNETYQLKTEKTLNSPNP